MSDRPTRRAAHPDRQAGRQNQATRGRRLVIAALCALSSTTIALPAHAAAPPTPVRATTATPATPANTGATSSDALPPGFRLDTAAGTRTLRWTGPRVRIGGARPEFRLGETLLGYPREVGGELRLPLTDDVALPTDRLGDVSVWSGGRRLDGAAANRHSAPSEVQAAAVTPTPTVPADPAAKGPYATARLSYSLPGLTVPGLPAPVEVLGEVTRPVKAPGARPLVLLLHGRHGTCYRGGPSGEDSGDWPCAKGWKPIPSYLGYRYLADALASQGYLTVSISANGINGQDYAAADGGAEARSLLVRHHLDLWAGWNRSGGDPWKGLLKGGVDLTHVALMGHSRGGEGVSRAAVDAPAGAGYRIRGLVLIGPTSFGRQGRPDVHTAVLLPSCDGDVSDLQGQTYVDDSRDLATSSALRTAVLALGANHNFFNTEWTPGLAAAPAFDDWYDDQNATCGTAAPTRLKPAQQQVVGAAYTLALVRLALASDKAMLPLLDGTRVKPTSIGRAETSVSAVGGDSGLLYRPQAKGTPALSRGMSGRECAGYALSPDEAAQARACGDGDLLISPHWLPMYGAQDKPAPQALQLSWAATGALARLDIGTVDLSSHDSIDLRIANDPTLPSARLTVRVRDAVGAIATLPADPATIAGWPGAAELDRVQARTVRADLRGAKIDLRQVVSVDLVSATARGRVWVLDATASRHRLVQPVRVLLPQFSIGERTVAEGGPGSRTVTVPLTVRGTVTRATPVWVEVIDVLTGTSKGSKVTVPAGSTVVNVPVKVTGDGLYNRDAQYLGDSPTVQVTLAALNGAVTGHYLGGLRITEDDPVPVLSVDSATSSVAEGNDMVWRFRLSHPATTTSYTGVVVRPQDSTLTTDDVTPAFLSTFYDPPPYPPVPLDIYLSVDFDAGTQVATLRMPIALDGVSEPRESITFTIQNDSADPTLPQGGLTFTGVIAANTT